MVTESVPEPERHSASPQYGRRYYQQLISSHANDIKHTHACCPSRCGHNVSGMLRIPPWTESKEFFRQGSRHESQTHQNKPLFAICLLGSTSTRLVTYLARSHCGLAGLTDTICSVCRKLDELMMLSHLLQSQIWLKLFTGSHMKLRFSIPFQPMIQKQFVQKFGQVIDTEEAC